MFRVLLFLRQAACGLGNRLGIKKIGMSSRCQVNLHQRGIIYILISSGTAGYECRDQAFGSEAGALGFLYFRYSSASVLGFLRF
jgi:hypothetical protein